MSKSRFFWGLGIAILGLLLMIVKLFLKKDFSGLIFYGAIILIIGIVILLNKKEDKIEQIKSK